MVFFIIGIAALGAFLIFARIFVATDPRGLARALRYFIGILLIAVAAVLALGERWGLAAPIFAAGVSAIFIGRIGPIDLGGRRSSGSASTVRSAFLEMRLDHDSGAMTGRVTAGADAGKELDEFDENGLLRLRAELASDPQSVSLLEAYLDRRMAGWREHVEGDHAAGAGGAANAGAMTDEEAYQILGLLPGAGEPEIRAAHRRLMLKVHPDQGGSTFLAAKINEAKDRLLGKHR